MKPKKKTSMGAKRPGERKKLRSAAGSRDYHHEPHFQRPRFIRAPKVTLDELYRSINSQDWRKATSVHLKSVKPGRPLKIRDRTFSSMVGRTVTDENGHSHVIHVYYEGDTLKKSTPVVVKCTCVTGETLVLTDKGFKSIRSLARPLMQTETVNYIVNGKVHTGTAPFHVGKQFVWTLYLSNGEKIRLTPDHKVLVRRIRSHCDALERTGKRHGVKGVWVRVDELRVGDRIIMSENSNEKNSAYVEDDLEYYRHYFAGFFYGDGTFFSDGRPDLRFKSRAAQISALLERSGFIRRIVDLGKRWVPSLVGGRKGQVLLGRRAVLNVHAHEMLERCGITRENRHALTDAFIQTLREDTRRFHGFMAGLIDAEAWVAESMAIYGAQEMRALQRLMTEYGYASAKMKKVRDAGVPYQVLDSSGVSNRELWCITLDPWDTSLILSRMKLAKRRARGAPTPYKKELRSARVLRIKKKGGRANVYDIAVSGVHQYVANGVIVHNCHRFAFYYEVANSRKGLSFVQQSNGEMPVHTNPRARIGACGHIARVCGYIWRNQKKQQKKA